MKALLEMLFIIILSDPIAAKNIYTIGGWNNLKRIISAQNSNLIVLPLSPMART